MAEIKNKAQLLELYKSSVQAQDSESSKLTDWNEGSINDMIANAVTLVGTELVAVIVDGFNKTFIANTTGADRDELIVDRYGSDFSRLVAQKAKGFVRLSRPNASFGTVTIPDGSTFSTEEDANGEKQTFVMVATNVFFATDDLELFIAVEAEEAGVAGNVDANTIKVIDTPLDDESVVVTNLAAMEDGTEIQTDSEYLDYVTSKISTSRGGSGPAIEAALLEVPGIAKAKTHETFVRVRAQTNFGQSVGPEFSVVVAKVYIADANGVANPALIAEAMKVVEVQRALGVNVEVLGANAATVNWSATFTLNPSGPNFAEFSVNLGRIKATMSEYLNALAIGEAFDPSLGEYQIMQQWGSDGTDDLNMFETLSPTGRVQPALNTKIIPGTMSMN